MVRLSFLLLLAGLPRIAAAQSDVFWKPGVRLSDETQAVVTKLTDGSPGPAGSSVATVFQRGTANRVDLSDSGGSSELAVLQSGSGNGASLNNGGGGNRVRLSQNGDGNWLGVAINGDQNALDLSQNGSGNVLDLRNVGASRERLDISQRGNGNQLRSDDYPFATGVPIRVAQTGGMQLQITNVR